MCGENEDHFPVRYFSVANFERENNRCSTRMAQSLISQLGDRKSDFSLNEQSPKIWFLTDHKDSR